MNQKISKTKSPVVESSAKPSASKSFATRNRLRRIVKHAVKHVVQNVKHAEQNVRPRSTYGVNSDMNAKKHGASSTKPHAKPSVNRSLKP
ncbi:hypothetical protein [Dermatophilus congolensis]|uniref:hypothetical protein n=1 Tax=Dermatophilus congolensis TaxID=1863 RepID=UPI0011C07674|nr:hypothetical protein [Dermatophilus congolensis]